MTYGAEVVILLEIGFPTLRTSSFIPSNNDELLGKSLDLIEEQKENVMVQLAYYQHKLKQGYDANMKLSSLDTGAWRLGVKKGFGYCKEPNMGKVKAQLGRAISHHLNGWNRCVSS